MRFLCFFVASMTVAIASSVSESQQLNKRLLGGNGGLIGGLVTPKKRLLGGILGNGLLGSILGKNGLLGNVGGLLNNVLMGLMKAVGNLLDSLTKALAGKTSKSEIYEELEKYPVEGLCIACDALTVPEHIYYCHQYCQEQIKKAQQ